MPHVRIRKTNRGMTKRETLVRATEEVIELGRSVRGVARVYNVSHATLNRFVQKTKAIKNSPGDIVSPNCGYMPHNKVFMDEYEKKVDIYINRCSDLYYGLTTRCAQKLAYEVAAHYNLKMPTSWKTNGMSGREWLRSFMRRNENFALKNPKQTGSKKAIDLNKSNVSIFFNKLGDAINSFNLKPQDIYNFDETGLKTHQEEKEHIEFMCLAVNAIGNIIPPLFIFPLNEYNPMLLRGGPIDSIGVANQSGSMQSEFMKFIEHFAKHTNCFQNNPKLLLLDNPHLHISLPVVNFCEENGIVLLTFPPDCPHKLQPLDSVFVAMKTYFDEECVNYMNLNAGDKINIYDIPELAKIALEKAAKPNYILSGFKESGIWPINPNVLSDDEFINNEAKKRPTISEIQNNSIPSTSSAAAKINLPSTLSSAVSFSQEIVSNLSKVSAATTPTDSNHKNVLEEESNKNNKNKPKASTPEKGDLCKETWNRLRNAYTNALNRRKTKPGEQPKKLGKWTYEDEMSFLAFTTAAKQFHNLDSTRDDSISSISQNETISHEDISPDGMEIITDHSQSSISHAVKEEILIDEPENMAPSSFTISEPIADKKKSKRKNTKLDNYIQSQNFLQNQSAAFSACVHDEDEMFFLSLAKFSKKLSPAERIRVKSEVSQLVFQAELSNLQNTENNYQPYQFPATSARSQSETSEQSFVSEPDIMDTEQKEVKYSELLSM